MRFNIDVKYEKIAVLKQKMGIPVIALVDTNSNPDGIDTVIPEMMMLSDLLD